MARLKHMKCDRCRRRKKKCDENRPQCHGCARAGTACVISEPKRKGVVKFIHVTAVSGLDQDSKPSFRVDVDLPVALCDPDINVKLQSPEPQSEVASTTTRSPTLDLACISRSSPDILQISLSAETKLASRWAAIMSPGKGENNPLEVWGLWGHFVPCQVQRSKAVMASAQCLMDSKVSFANGTDANLKVAQRSQIMALGALREALSSPRSADDRSTALLATFLIWVSCVVYDAAACAVHMKGLIDLLSQLPRGLSLEARRADEVTRSIFYSPIGSDYDRALIESRDSRYDHPYWLSLPPPKFEVVGCPGFSIAWKKVKHMYILLPRLTRHVRSMVESRDGTCREAAIKMGALLYSSNLETWIQDLTMKGALKIVPTDRKNLRTTTILSYEFSSISLYTLLIFYWCVRANLFGVIQTLAGVLGESSLFDLSTIQNQDMEAAANLAMCAQYAQTATPLPFATAVHRLVTLPLKCAFGSWHRLEKRSPEGSYEAMRARNMKEWTTEFCNGGARQFQRGYGVRSLKGFEVLAEVFSGEREGRDWLVSART